MKITQKILENIIKEEINTVLKGISDARTSLVKAQNELYGKPGADYAITNMKTVTGMLFVISDMLKGRYNKENAVAYGMQLPSGDASVDNRALATSVGDTEIKELKQIIAQETVATIMEQSDCKQVRLEDLEQIEELFDNICELLDDFIDKKREMLSPEENVTIDADTLRTTDKEMPADMPSEQSHEVVAGDTFWELARTYLGNPLRWKEIMNANMGLLKNRPKMQFKNTPEKIPPIRPGDILTIPSRS